MMLPLLLVGLAQAAPDCTGFGGMIHGTSACARYDRATGTLAAMTDRVMPGEGVVSAHCDSDVTVEDLSVRIECARTEGTTAVWLVVRADAAHPFAGERRLEVAHSNTFYDFINVWARKTPATLDLTVDFAILE